MLFVGRMRAWWVAKQRDLFWFWDGTKWHRADPVRIGTRLEDVLPDYLELLGVAAKTLETVPIGNLRTEALKAKKEAILALTGAVRKVLDLKPLTETDGVGDGEAFRVLVEYVMFMQDLGQSAESFTASPQPTA